MKKSPIIQCLIILACILQSTILPAQKDESVLNTNATSRIHELFAPWNSNKNPGASIAIIKNGAVIFEAAYGSANLEFGFQNTSKTLFNIASNSKQFTAYAMLNLVREGKLSLEDDIRKYIPELPDFGETIKIKNLAQHTHGIRGITYLLGMAGWHIEDVITRKAVLKLLTQQQELNFAPETDFSYNNSGYMLLAEIIERVSGKPFHEYLKEIIFTPLEMNNTVLFEDYEKVIPNLSNPYFFDGTEYKKGIRNSKNIVGNSGIRTNVEDLSKWVINFEKSAIGNEELFEKLIQPSVLKNGDTLRYSFGQIVSKYKGRRVVSHGGAEAGYRSEILRFPDESVSIIVLTNDGSLNAEEKAYLIADIYLDKKAATDISRGSTVIKTSRVVPKETLKKYEGKFELQPGFIMEFNEKEGKLYITATGQGTLPLETLNDTQFQIRRISAVITFIKNEDGDFDDLTFDHDGGITEGKRVKFNIDLADIEKYAGTYYSNELKTSYKIIIKNGVLIAKHQRQEDTKLTPLSNEVFSGNTWFFGTLNFVFADDGVKGFRVSSDRVKNLWFEKIKTFPNP
jgi:CubicO group peptidase (beta-lactamase class C family)